MKLALGLEYPIGLQGGVSVLVATLTREFVRQGHEVVLISTDSTESLQTSAVGKLIRQHFHWDWPQDAAEKGRQLASCLAQAGVQIAHFHSGGNYGWGNRFPGYSPAIHLSKRGVPCLSTVHLVVNILDGYCGPQKPTWFKLLMLPLAWWSKTRQLAHVSHEIAVSQHDLKKLKRWYWPWRERFIQIYHSRIEDASFAAHAGPRAPVILNVGHLALRKGQAALAEAFARVASRHPQWTLQLAGHDSGDGTAEQIRRIAKTCQLETRILLLGERADALELMQQASIYVQPSSIEALGLALQEAMFCGCACAGARAGGIPELLADGQTGRLFEPANIDQLAAILDELIKNPAERESFGKAAMASIHGRGMTAEAMSKRHLQLYAEVMRSGAMFRDHNGN